jgi:hypothetical protein
LIGRGPRKAKRCAGQIKWFTVVIEDGQAAESRPSHRLGFVLERFGPLMDVHGCPDVAGMTPVEQAFCGHHEQQPPTKTGAPGSRNPTAEGIAGGPGKYQPKVKERWRLGEISAPGGESG